MSGVSERGRGEAGSGGGSLGGRGVEWSEGSQDLTAVRTVKISVHSGLLSWAADRRRIAS